ncbi:sensor histidine kinase [Maribacter hydrothermalis]|uniref:histidine kinase n=1 Tax=Maribacter hydrothermalis TaxID=1836467 RepID=A0A1B7Z498_9FLAO|nr:HAMP domain-containing sensor histidine kinase [Maribacter hydrothermalis]APQ17280.1 two-component sensor histidine kinase [Maribacter hydrothermalis]OBR37539.1 two-component sensor histidine kinase [Maribacter hydrothermalis]
MKLLNHTTKYFAILLIVLISIWAVIFYFAMLDEVYDSLDDGLENQKELIIRAVNDNPYLLQDTEFGVNNYTIKNTQLGAHTNFKDSYRDTIMYMQNEDEYEPIRMLESTFKQGDSYYKIKLITSMVEEDDQIENLFKYLVGLYLLLILSIVVLNNLVMKKVWKPFYMLIDRLKGFRIEKDDPITSVPTTIDEFNLLNQSVERLTEKSRDSYVAQKEFIENAAHELQTPLAIAINKLELLLEKNDLSGIQSQEVGSVLDNLTRLTRLNKSLLLLSKIDNKQYLEEETIDFNELIKNVTTDFSDFATHKNMRLNVVANANIRYTMNTDLAIIMMTNLIKNAIIHGQAGKEIDIVIDEGKISLKNFGIATVLDTNSLFKRFKKTSANSRSTGLGLAISKAITDKYHLILEYSFTEKHNFTLIFPPHR